MVDEKQVDRRNLLRVGLASVAGVAAGYSLFVREALAATDVAKTTKPQLARPVSAKSLNVTVPPVALRGEGRQRTLTNRQDVLNSIAPVMVGLLEQTGDQLSPDQLSKVRAGLLSKGSLQLPKPGQGAASITISTLEF